jgi:hypothetical protein
MAQQFLATRISSAYWRVVFSHPPMNLIDPETIVEFSSWLAKSSPMITCASSCSTVPILITSSRARLGARGRNANAVCEALTVAWCPKPAVAYPAIPQFQCRLQLREINLVQQNRAFRQVTYVRQANGYSRAVNKRHRPSANARDA